MLYEGYTQQLQVQGQEYTVCEGMIECNLLGCPRKEHNWAAAAQLGQSSAQLLLSALALSD